MGQFFLVANNNVVLTDFVRSCHRYAVNFDATVSLSLDTSIECSQSTRYSRTICCGLGLCPTESYRFRCHSKKSPENCKFFLGSRWYATTPTRLFGAVCTPYVCIEDDPRDEELVFSVYPPLGSSEKDIKG